MKKLDLSGKVFNRLTVVEQIGVKNGHKLWRCVCSCGTETEGTTGSLRFGTKKSCGCLVADANRLARLGKPSKIMTHGESSAKTRTPEFMTWLSMRQRCNDKNHSNYKNYGAKGITVCERWQKSYENFLADMGRKPDHGSSIDRIDAYGNYEPSNCRWATMLEQQNNRTDNRMVLVDGVLITATEAARKLRIPSKTFFNRLNKFDAGLIPMSALVNPARGNVPVLPNGETVKQAAIRLNISVAGLNYRLNRVKQGVISLDQALSQQNQYRSASLRS